MRYMYLLLLAVVLSSCAKEFRNPYDPATPPDIWMPRNLSIEKLGVNSLRLKWEQEEQNINGFVLKKIIGNQTTEYQLSKDSLSFTDLNVDSTFVLDSCKNVQYFIRAKAGERLSTEVGTTSAIIIPILSKAYAGDYLNPNTLTITLNASLPYIGETGHWEVLSGISGVFSNINSYSSTFSGLSGFTYKLKWTINSNCETTFDEVEITFPLLINDASGNIYSAIKIGNQTWFSENLRTEKYYNGDLIPNCIDNTQWSGLTTGAWSYYNNASSNNEIYGKLYNWYAVTDSRNVCPCGWHLPSDSEWTILIDYLGGNQVAGGKMKTIGTSLWQSPNTSATNISGFSGLPGGYRGNIGVFNDLGSYSNWWSYSESFSNNASSCYISYSTSNAYQSYSDKKNGLSVRCLKD